MEENIRRKIHHQSVGAYGEKVVEAELLREGWIPANVNASVKNAAEYDIVAQKEETIIPVRVKACGPGQRAFQWSIKPGMRFSAEGLRSDDFTVLVSMGQKRDGDEFWVVPTALIRERLRKTQDEYLSGKRRDGGARVDNGQWTLWLDPLKRHQGSERASHGIAVAWKSYHDNWRFKTPAGLSSKARR